MACDSSVNKVSGNYEISRIMIVGGATLFTAVKLMQGLLKSGGASNLQAYIIGVVCALSVMALFGVIFAFWSAPTRILHNVLEFGLPKVISTLLTVFLVAIWTMIWHETYYITGFMPDGPRNYYSWQKIPVGQFCTILGVILLIFFVLERRFRILERENRVDILEWIVMLALVVFSFITHYFSSFANCFYTLYHSDAYFNNVYNAYYGTPYSNLNFGTYGHYGILLSALLHLVGLQNFNIVMAVLSALIVVFGFYCIKKLVRSPAIRIMAYFAMVAVNARNFIDLASLQGTPHRQIFPLLMCALCVWGITHDKTRTWTYRVAVFVTAALAIQWNLETGIACAFGGAFVHCIDALNDGLPLPKTIGRIGLSVAFVLFAFLAAWGLTSVWNIFVGGYWLPLREFLVPITGIDYNVDFVTGLELPLQSNNSLWIWIVMMYLFFIAVAWVKSSMIGGGKPRKDQIAAGAIATIGIIHLTFFINRAGWGGLFVAVYTGFILVPLLVQWAVDWSSAWKGTQVKYVLAHSAKIMMASLLLLFAISTPFLAHQFQQGKIESISTQLTAEETVLKGIRENVPADTKAVGIGSAYIYSRLGWENPLRICDAAAMGSSKAASEFHKNNVLNSQEPIVLFLYGESLVWWAEAAPRYEVLYYTEVCTTPVVYVRPIS